MPIRPLEINGTITRVQDVVSLKHNEENRHLIEQNSMMNHSKKEVEHQQKKVRNADDSNYHQKQFDAKEKGNGFYFSEQKKKKDGKSMQGNKKIKKSSGGFDISI